jgi:hypothetical protein
LLAVIILYVLNRLKVGARQFIFFFLFPSFGLFSLGDDANSAADDDVVDKDDEQLSAVVGIFDGKTPIFFKKPQGMKKIINRAR